LSFVSLVGAAAQAQDRPRADVFLGYSYVRANPATPGFGGINLNGGSASISVPVNNWLSGVANFSGYHDGNVFGIGCDGTVSTYLFGPRVTLRHAGPVEPFGQVLFGVAHADAGVFNTFNDHNSFAMAIGGGVDVKLSHHLAVRPVELDYL